MKGWKKVIVFCLASYITTSGIPVSSEFNSHPVKLVDGLSRAEKSNVYISRIQEGYPSTNPMQNGNDLLQVFLPTLKALDIRCTQGKDHETVDNVRIKLDTLIKCATRSIDALKNLATNLVTDKSDQSNTQKLQTVVCRACRAIRTIKRCSKKATDWAMICLTSTELEESTRIFNAMYGIMDYFCKENATKLLDFVHNGGHVCALSHGEALQHCMAETRNMTRPEGTIPAFDEEKCMTASEVTTCAITEFSRCPNKEPVGILREIFDIIWKELPCLELQYLNTF